MEDDENKEIAVAEDSKLERGVPSSLQSVLPQKPLRDTNESAKNAGSGISGQDSGLSSVEGSSQCQASSGQRIRAAPYTTSTPKKGVQFMESVRGLEVLPSHVILDDPLLSSIDDPGEDLTDQDVNSFTCDDESDDEDSSSSTKLFETKINVNLGSGSTGCTLMSRFMSDGSTKEKDTKRSSFCEAADIVTVKPELSAIRRNLFDIPVSPKLKSKVRQRLYTLVNSIDGYETNLDIESDENNLSKCENSASLSISESKKLSAMPFYSKYRSGHSPRTLPDMSLSRHDVSNESKGCHRVDKDQNNSINRSRFPSLNSEICERYASAVSSMIESQLQNLSFHQEQLDREKLNFTLRKKEDEVDARMSLYKEKLFQMVQVSYFWG